jgi:hypothetical protein
VVTFKRKSTSGSFGAVPVKKGAVILDCGGVMTGCLIVHVDKTVQGVDVVLEAWVMATYQRMS